LKTFPVGGICSSSQSCLINVVFPLFIRLLVGWFFF
jgi:hypothetical protein